MVNVLLTIQCVHNQDYKRRLSKISHIFQSHFILREVKIFINCYENPSSGNTTSLFDHFIFPIASIGPKSIVKYWSKFQSHQQFILPSTVCSTISHQRVPLNTRKHSITFPHFPTLSQNHFFIFTFRNLL